MAMLRMDGIGTLALTSSEKKSGLIGCGSISPLIASQIGIAVVILY
jgi:hypothetical protein